MRILLTYFLFILVSAGVLAQGGSAAHIREADKFYADMSFAKAIPEYQAAAEQGAVNEHVTSRLAECYLRLNDPQKAEYWYSTVVKFLNCSPVNYYYYAEALKANSRYEQAERWMDKYLVAANTTGSKRSNISDFARKFAYDIDRYAISTVSANTKYSDFAPAWLGDSKLVFASSRKETVGLQRKAGYNDQPFLDLYMADIMPSGDISSVQSMGGDINSKFHEGPVTSSVDGKTLYFTRNDLFKGRSQKGKNGVHHLNIYSATASKNSWKDVREFAYNKSEFSVGHPTLSKDGKRIFFASNIPGGEGGSDIYYCDLIDGVWGDPKNLGTGVNTAQDEMFPYIAADATLYFASNGHPGLGGLDIFAAPVQETGNYDLSINMGAPVNGPRDDFGLIIDEGGKQGYFASNRPGGKGDDDIYHFKQLSALAERFLCTGQIVDAEFSSNLENVDVVLQTGDGEEVARSKTDPEGKFVFPINKGLEYKVVASVDGRFESIFHFDSHEIEKRQIVSCMMEMAAEDGILMRGVARTANGGYVRDMTVSLVSLTTFETKTTTTGPGGDFHFKADPEDEYEILFEKRGYFSQTVPASTQGLNEGLIDLNKIRALKFDLAEVGKPIIVPEVRWNGSEERLDGIAKAEVELLAEKLMVNPSMVIEIGVHTDARGDATENLALSQARADKVKEFLVIYGLRENRVATKGYGSSRLINRCIPGAECTDAEHGENVRLEYIVTGYFQ